MTKFKLGLLIVFGVFIVFGIITFASSKSGNNVIKANLHIWGTISEDKLRTFISTVKYDEDQNITVDYSRKDPETFDAELAEALADGRGPDMIILPQDMLFRHKNKIFTIPYKNYTEREFKDSFIEASEVYLSKDGILALPLIIDPMVMYWNRDIFKENSLTLPPKYWDEFLNLSPRITRKDSSGNFTRTAIAFGEWRNVTNAKDILSNLLLQSGLSIVINGEYKSTDLSGSIGRNIASGNSVLGFYTEFANPTSPIYSWNRSLPSSANYFLSGNLATYMGFASDLPKIREKNPNLNFDLTYIPLPRQTQKPAVFAKIYGIAMLKQSSNLSADLAVMRILTSPSVLTSLESNINLPPIRRSMLSSIPTDSAYREVFYKSAIISKVWMDPDKKATDQIMQSMIESITSGRLKIESAIERANEELNAIINK